jgi:glycosyltransferase involved in cell wall biosynthesis
MACATPVIAARAGALPEVVGDAALLVDPRDPAAITTAMARLEREPAQAAALGQAGLERARAFRWERAAADVMAVLEELA